MINMSALRPAVNAVIPHLPKAAGVAFTRALPFLPLALELAQLLYKHRQKIRDVTNNLTNRAFEIAKASYGRNSKRVRSLTTSLLKCTSHLGELRRKNVKKAVEDVLARYSHRVRHIS